LFGQPTPLPRPGGVPARNRSEALPV
jgi:hypothetical protein